MSRTSDQQERLRLRTDDFMAALYGPDDQIKTLFGDLGALAMVEVRAAPMRREAASKAIENYFGGWPAGRDLFARLVFSGNDELLRMMYGSLAVRDAQWMRRQTLPW